MSYSKTWLPLEEAVARAVTLTGIANTEEIRADLCQMVADRKIHVRVTIANGHVFDGLNVSVPAQLSHADFDWPNSRPKRPWFVGPGVSWKMARGEWSEDARSIWVIEVRADDLEQMNASAPRKTGLPGRPSSWHLIESELRRRHDAGNWKPPQSGGGRIVALAREMQQWLTENYPLAPQPKEKTLTNRLGPLLAELRKHGMSDQSRNPRPK